MEDRIYTIPNRFGLRALILVTGIFGVVFGVTQSVQAELRVVAPVLSFIVLICLAQILLGRIPRVASILVGAFVFPMSALIDPLFEGQFVLQPIGWVDLFWLIACGMLAGYMGGVLLAGVFLVADHLQVGRREAYSVPRRFGTGTMLVATTLFAILFAFLKWANARPAELFFYASFVATVAAAQMALPRMPRWASVVAGGVYLPLSMVLFGRMRMGRRWRVIRAEFDSGFDLESILYLAALGLLIGYLGGALIAGIFLVTDYVLKYFSPRGNLEADDKLAAEESMPRGSLTILAERAMASRQKAS
jgi:hypothetical protein